MATRHGSPVMSALPHPTSHGGSGEGPDRVTRDMMVPMVAGRTIDADSVRVAHADAWEAHGRYREPSGGGVERLQGIRLMASGLPHPQWNSGDVLDGGLVDVSAVASWYDAKGVPWGVRGPQGMTWAHGRRLFPLGLRGLEPVAFCPTEDPAGFSLREAGPADVNAV